MDLAYSASKQFDAHKRGIRVNALLKLNPKYSDWSATVGHAMPGASADDKSMMIFMKLAADVGPDGQFKRDSTYTRWDARTASAGFLAVRTPGKTPGYDDLLMHK